VKPFVAKPAGDVRKLQGFHDTQMHELDSVIALRECSLAWPVLWNANDDIICGAHPDGPDKDFIGAGIMPRMSAREDAIKEFEACWNQYAHFGLVPTTLERAIRRNPSLYLRKTPPKTAVAAAVVLVSEVEEWLIDTGCGYDLVCKADVQKVLKHVEEGEPVTFETAGGEVPARDVIPLFLPHMQQSIRPYVLNTTPNVLSVGARCQEFGWCFVWEPWSKTPYFRDPTGRKIDLVTEGNISYLKSSAPAMASAAP
jgi:hypothetical protein